MKTFRILLPILLAFTVGMFGTEWLAKQTQYDLGVVVVRLGGYDFSTGLPQTIVLLATVAVLIWLVWTSLKLPFKTWRSYQQRQDLNRFVDGLRHAELGQWQRAEQLLMKASKNSAIGGVAIAAAIRCANWHQDSQHIDNLLQRLGVIDPILAAIEQSDRQVHQGQAQRALEILATVQQTLPPRGEWIRMQALIQEERGQEASLLMETLSQQGFASSAKMLPLEQRVHLTAFLQIEELETLQLQWDHLSNALQVDPTLVYHYAQRALRLGADPQSLLKTIEASLETHVDGNLAVLYATLPIDQEERRLDFLQSLMAKTEPTPDLLTAIGHLHTNDKQLEKAFELASQAILSGGKRLSWELLSRLFQTKGQTDQALQCQINANQLLNSTSIAAPLAELDKVWRGS